MAGKKDIVEKALKLIEGTGPELTANGIRAYHGSPYEFDRFDISKLGTGEGQQAYGHGLYFAGKEDIAKWYRDKLSRGTFYSGERIGDMHPSDSPQAAAIHSIAPYIADGKDPADAIAQQWAKWNASYEAFLKRADEMPDKRDKALARAQSFKDVADELLKLDPQKFTKNPGHMYEVGIEADPNRLLDWNDPLKAQPADVRSAIMPFAEERADRMNKTRRELLDRGVDMLNRPFRPERLQKLQEVADPETFTGENIYRQIQAKLGAGTPNQMAAEASKFLTDQGLHGMKFLDASSRGAGIIEPTNNFVIPEDKRIKIIRRYEDGGEVTGDTEDMAQDRDGYASKGRVAKKAADEATALAKRILGAEPDVRTIKGAELLKKTEGLSEDPFGYSKFAKPLSEMEYTVKMLPREEYKTIDPYDLVKRDAKIAGHISDRTAAGREITNIGGVDLTEPLTQRGGVDYQRTTPYAWANRPGAGKGLNKKLNEASKGGEPVYTTPVFMGASSANSSHMVGVPLIRMIPNLPISKGDKMAFDAMMSERFPGWPGIDNTEEAEKFMYSGKVPGSAISRFIDYASAKKWKGAGFPDTSEIMFSAMDPRLVGVPQGSTGMGLKEFDPGKEVIIRGEMAHPDYPASIPGKEYAGGFKYQVPQSLMFSDWWKSLKPELRLPENATKAQHTLMTQVPIQKATPEWADQILEYWEKNPVPWGYADGGEVNDDINDALRIAKDVGGATSENPQVFLTDAQGRQYDAQGRPIAPANPATGQTTSAAVDSPNATNYERRGVLEVGEPEKYESDVKPLIDYAVTPIDRPGMPSEPDLVNVMKIATQIAAEGQPSDSRGAGNLGRRREEAVRSFMGADPEGYASGHTGPFSYNPSEMADYVNTLIDFSPVALGEVAHDIPYEAGRTGDYGAAAVEGGINAALTAPVMGMAGRGIKKGYQYLKQSPALAAGAAGMAGLTAGTSEAEAGPARWFSKAMEVANAIPMEKMTGQQALAMLKKAVSPEELRWTGTEKFLTSRPQVSKGELLDHLNKNRIQVNEITLGGNKPTDVRMVMVQDIPREIRDKYMPQINDLMDKKIRANLRAKGIKQSFSDPASQEHLTNKEYLSALQDAVDYGKQMDELSIAMRQEYVDSIGGLARPTKYESYSTPGGEGYTETLYTLGRNKKPRVEQRNRMFYLVDENGNTLRNQSGGEYSYYSDNDANRAAASIYRGGGQYSSSHWDDPDVIAHSRSQMLVYDPPGANRPYRVHNVDETQSDWGQDARKKGVYDPDAYKNWERDTKDTKEAIRDLSDRLSMRADEIDESLGPKPTRWRGEEFTNYHERRQAAMDNDPKIQEMRKQMEDYRLKLMQLDENKPSLSGVPSAPYIGSTEGWTDLAIKRQLDKALDSDADYFSWTPGQAHAERYDLSKHIGKVEYDPYYQMFRAFDPDGRQVVRDEINDTSRIDDYVGKELGDKIREMVDQRKSEFYNGITIEKNPNIGSWDNWAIVRDGKPIILHGQEAMGFPSKAYAAEFLDDAFGDTLRDNPIRLEGLDLRTGGEGMIGYYDKVYLKRVQDVIKKATGTKPEIEVIEVQTADGPRKQIGIRLTDEMREKARFSDFNKGGRVTGGNAYGNDKTVDSALALTREY